MIIYNVTVKVETGAVQEWLQWMTSEHLQDMMATNCFLDRTLCRLMDQDENEGPTFVVQYRCESMDEYKKYINEHAAGMRQKGIDRFQGRFVAFRTIMEVL